LGPHYRERSRYRAASLRTCANFSRHGGFVELAPEARRRKSPSPEMPWRSCSRYRCWRTHFRGLKVYSAVARKLQSSGSPCFELARARSPGCCTRGLLPADLPQAASRPFGILSETSRSLHCADAPCIWAGLPVIAWTPRRMSCSATSRIRRTWRGPQPESARP